MATEANRREIEEFLALWLRRLRSAIRVSSWFTLPVVVILVVSLIPPFCRMVWLIPGWQALFQSALLVGALGCLLVVGSPPTLMLLAETAKANLEEARLRRPFAEFLRDHARRSDWRRLWIQEAFSIFILLEGVWLLWPRRETIMIPARFDPHFLPAGALLTLLGVVMGLIKLWQIRAKLRS